MVWYSVARQTSENEAGQAIGELEVLGIEFIDADWKITRIAAAYKSKNAFGVRSRIIAQGQQMRHFET